MLKMNKRGKFVNWSKLANASPKPKRLQLEEDDCDGLFHCPVQISKHDGFTTQRGCRKHVKNKHSCTITWTRSQTVLKSIRFMSIKTITTKPMIRRLHRVKAGQLPLLILQTKLPRPFFHG